MVREDMDNFGALDLQVPGISVHRASPKCEWSKTTRPGTAKAHGIVHLRENPHSRVLDHGSMLKIEGGDEYF